MPKINKLTPEQELRLPAFRADYLAHGLNTAPADRPRAEAAFARAYAVIGKTPVPVLWVDSPITASMALSVLKHFAADQGGDSLTVSFEASFWSELEEILQNGLQNTLQDGLQDRLLDSLRDSLGNSLGNSLWGILQDSLRDSLGNDLHDDLRDGFWNSLWSSLGDSLRRNLGTGLWDSLRRNLGAGLRASLGEGLGSSVQDGLSDKAHDDIWISHRDSKIAPEYTYWWGQQDLYWIAFYKFCAEIGVPFEAEAADRLDIMHEIGLSCMWWYPRDGLIIACERPLSIKMDERERLHSDTGPAVAFRDGWSIYSVHGVRVPAWVITDPARLTLAAISAETNSEVQRVMIERYGWDRYVGDVGGEIVDHDERWGTLLRTPAGLVLKVINRSPEADGSFRQYILPVAGNCEPLPDSSVANVELGAPQSLTALNAVASTFGMSGAAYAELIGEES